MSPDPASPVSPASTAVPAAPAASAAPDAGPGADRRQAWAEVDLGAIRDNAAAIAEAAAPAAVCAVVKAGGYGHGAPQAARAALEGGAAWLAVALVEEGRELREAGIHAPVLLLSEPAPDAMEALVDARLTPTLYTLQGGEALLDVLRSHDRSEPYPVHVKADTGMHRVGAAPAEAVALAAAMAARPELSLEGFWTHLAVADELDNPYTAGQLATFEEAIADLRSRGVTVPVLHAGNSAGALWHPASRYDMVRAGIALYGLAPAADLVERPPMPRLRSALSLKARVTYVKKLAPGERLSYGLRYELKGPSVIATVPLGYADGVTRSLPAEGGQVLVDGHRCPIAGTVTMDQILVDCGTDSRVAPGDEVVLLGRQGDEEITAWEWAQRTGTIAYEVVCGVSGRVPRLYRDL